MTRPDDNHPTAHDDMHRISWAVAVLVFAGTLTGFAAAAWLLWRMIW